MKHTSKTFPLTPLGDRIVVKPSEKVGEKKLASGIIIPETVNKEKLFEGEVVAVGPGKRAESGERIPLEVAIGDRVFFKKPWDEAMKLEGEEYYILTEADLLGIAN